MNYSMQWHFTPCAMEIGHFHLLEFKFGEIAQKSKKGIIGAKDLHYSKCATSQRQVFKERRISMKLGLKDYSFAEK